MRIAIIQPAGKVFDRTFEAIAVAAKDFGSAEIFRVSTDLSQHQLASTFDQLAHSTMVIIDLTARNPNVMFLTGYALALNKKVKFIAQHIEDFPFDHSTDPIVYGADFNYLTHQIVLHIAGDNTTNGPASNTDAHSEFLSIFGDLLQKHGYEHRGPIVQDEPRVFTLVEQDMDLPLVQDIARRGRELGIRVRLL